jgi:RHS repeat-associated protein
VADVVNATVAPFESAPPPGQGTATTIAQKVGGALALVGAPAKIIDTAFAELTAPIAAMFPAMPAVTLGAMHVGPPHGHTHPPSLIPPAPTPIPLPSLGPVMGAGSITVLIGGMPAARAGDIGISVTCGSLAPPFEISTGSSNVFIGGARAARVMDITKHCNPAAEGPFAIAMGVAGAVVGAVAAPNTYALAQAAADAATLAMKLLCGKDPGIPPGMGALVGPPVPNVLIGGFPCPPIGQMAVGALLKAIKAAAGAFKKGEAPEANGSCGRAGEPVDVVTGETFTNFVDFVSGGGFEWRRHYTTARARQDGPLGHGWRHSLERSLRVRLHRAIFTDWTGTQVEFPAFPFGEHVVRSHGRVLRRLGAGRYRLSHRGQPDLEFEGNEFEGELRLARVIAGDHEITLEHGAHGRLISVVQSGREPGQRRRYELHYDVEGHVRYLLEVPAAAVAAARPEPIVRAAYAYTATSELRRATDAMGGRWTYEYDAFHRLTKQTDPREYSFFYRYDALGRCVQTSGQDGLWAATIEYFPEKKVSRFTEGEGAIWEVHYDGDGVVTKLVDPYGGTKLRERDGQGRMAREIDSGGRLVEWLYDEDGAHYARRDRFANLLPPETGAQTLANPYARRIPGTALGRVFDGGFAAPLHDHFGCDESLFRSMAPAVERMARLCFATRGTNGRGAAKARIERDALGRATAQVDALGRVRGWQYDATGNVVARRDRDGRVAVQETTSWNLLGERRTADGHSTKYRYSRLQDVTAVIDPLGNETRYEYDLKGRLVGVRRGGDLRDRYVYDLGDHLVEKCDGRGAVIFTNELHENHFVKERRLASGGVHRFDYDERGRLIEASTGEHQVRMEHDPAGRLQCDLRDDAGIEHEYAAAGTGAQSSTRSTLLGRYVSIVQRGTNTVLLVDPAGRETRLLFHADGTVVRTCSNGSTEILQYDGDGRLRGRLLQGRHPHDRSPAWSDAYVYTADGDLVRRDDSQRGTFHYEVDAAHRLVAEVLSSGERTEYGYDAADNLHLGWLQIGPDNRLVASADEKFTYDDRGRLSVRQRADGGEVRYAYDSCDMLVAVDGVSDGGAWRWTASYDAIGRLIETRNGAERREFFWDGDRLAAEILPSGGLRIYQYATGAAFVPLGFIDYPDREAGIRSGRSYHVFSDPTGMPLHIEDGEGRVAWWAQRIHPFGAVRIRAGATVEYNLRWPGHYRHPSTGLHYNRFRYYDPALGRYLQSDPIGYKGSPVNLYAYCANPLVHVDVLGLHDDEETGSQGPTNEEEPAPKQAEEPPEKPPEEPTPPEEPPRQPTLREATRAAADQARNDDPRPAVVNGMQTPDGATTTAPSYKGDPAEYHGLDGADGTKAAYDEAAQVVRPPPDASAEELAKFRPDSSGKCGEAQNMAAYERQNGSPPPEGTQFDSARVRGPNSDQHGTPIAACPYCSYVQDKYGYGSQSGQSRYTTASPGGGGSPAPGGAGSSAPAEDASPGPAPAGSPEEG